MLRSKTGVSSALLAGAVLVCSCAHTGPAALPPQRFTAAADKPPAFSHAERKAEILAAREKLDALVSARFAKAKLPGLAVGLVLDRELIWSAGLGTRKIGEQQPVSAGTVFRIGSVTKLFTGLALLALRDEGLLRLDDPVARFLPEIARVVYPSADSPRIAIRHLVTHTSGLPRVGKLDYAERQTGMTEAQVLAGLDDLALSSAPGTKTEYSNLAMGLAGLVIERAAHAPVRALISRRILGPLGMAHTVWTAADVPAGALATGYREAGGSFSPAEPWRFGAVAAMGGLYSSLADLARFAGFELAAWPP